MRGGEFVSAGIQLLIAAYLIYFYPSSVRRQFQNRPIPPFFRIMANYVPAAGYLLAAGTLLYVTLRLAGHIAS